MQTALCFVALFFGMVKCYHVPYPTYNSLPTQSPVSSWYQPQAPPQRPSASSRFRPKTNQPAPSPSRTFRTHQRAPLSPNRFRSQPPPPPQKPLSSQRFYLPPPSPPPPPPRSQMPVVGRFPLQEPPQTQIPHHQTVLQPVIIYGGPAPIGSVASITTEQTPDTTEPTRIDYVRCYTPYEECDTHNHCKQWCYENKCTWPFYGIGRCSDNRFCECF